MNIVHVFHHFAPCTGGIETVILQLSKQLEKSHSVKVVCLNKCPKGKEKLPAMETMHGIEVERIPFIDLGFYKFAPSVSKHIKEADLVHVHGINFFLDFLAITKALHGKKMVLSTHGGIFHTHKKSILKRAYFFGWCGLALKQFEKIICVSRNDFELFSKIAPQKKLALVENGVEFEKFYSCKKQKKQNSFIFLGRISRNKRIDNLIEAFSILAKEGLDFELHIAGMDFDNLAGKMKEIVEQKGIGKNVFFHGELPEKKVLELFGSSEFFVSASEYEGFGITALEAMAAGCIPILNNIDSFNSFVSDAHNGFIADFAESKKAAAKIAGAMTISRKEKQAIAEKAVETAKKYSWEKKAKEFEKIYSEVLE